MSDLQLPAYDPNKEVVVVRHIADFPSAPYYVSKLMSWGLSSGTCYRENKFSTSADYVLLYQQGSFSVYRQK